MEWIVAILPIIFVLTIQSIIYIINNSTAKGDSNG